LFWYKDGRDVIVFDILIRIKEEFARFVADVDSAGNVQVKAHSQL
jgi:hypothetical protein